MFLMQEEDLWTMQNCCKENYLKKEIIPEISLKNPNPVCNDCLSMICSTNKMLYDFA